MPEFLSLIKIIAIVQVILIILLLIFAYAIKVYCYYKLRRNLRITHAIEQCIADVLKSKDNEITSLMLPYKKQNIIVLDLINKFDATIATDAWNTVRNQLIDVIVLPQARGFSKSKQWYKRYIACRSFQLCLNLKRLTKQDEDQIRILISDSVKLVSINAAILALRYNSQDMLDTVIDFFSIDRRVQQSLVSQVISGSDAGIIPLIMNRIKRETNPYVKAFCYRILIQLPFASETCETADIDVKSSTIDLRLAAIEYIFHNNPTASATLLIRLLNDEHWQVRARSAKLLGQTGDESFVSELEVCLKDPDWWVRNNAAVSLFALGQKGIFVLKNQNPTVDQYAYDMAMQVLLREQE